MKNVILNNAGLKLLALFLAVITWAYIITELNTDTTEEREMLQSIFPYRMATKKLPVRLNVMGEPQDGYVIAYDRVVIRPSEIVIVGPQSVIQRLSSIETQPIDISGHSRTFTKDVGIISPTKDMIKERFITVTIPIAKEKD